MIKIVKCLSCKHYKRGKCLAFPKGIPDDILFDEDRDKKRCGNGINYENILEK